MAAPAALGRRQTGGERRLLRAGGRDGILPRAQEALERAEDSGRGTAHRLEPARPRRSDGHDEPGGDQRPGEQPTRAWAARGAGRPGSGRATDVHRQARRLSTSTRSRVPNSSTHRPAPRATAWSGSSAVCTGTPSSWDRALVETADECATSGERDATVDDVAGQLGRADVEDGAHELDDLDERGLDGPAHLGRADRHGLGQARDEVAAAHPLGELLAQREGGAGADLEVLGAALAEEQGVLALDVGHEGLVDLVPADPHGARGDDAAQADDRDVGGAPADVDDHRGPRLLDGEARRRSRRPSSPR